MKKRAGRKPQGDIHGKSAVFSTRITPETRAGLEREARRSGKSLSQEIERRLRDSLQAPKKRGLALEKEHNQALAVLIGRLTGTIETTTGESWQRDRFTSEVLLAATQVLLTNLAPEGDAKMPRALEKQIQRAPAYADHFRNPISVGAACALTLQHVLITAEYPPLDHPTNQVYSDAWYTLPWAREKLGLKGETR